jgi:hypothetical protein
MLRLYRLATARGGTGELPDHGAASESLNQIRGRSCLELARAA